jgi:hypothetical protein
MHLRLMCFFDRHISTPNRVKWDGRCYVTVCQKCGRPIARAPRQKWRAIPIERIEHKKD